MPLYDLRRRSLLKKLSTFAGKPEAFRDVLRRSRNSKFGTLNTDHLNSPP